VIGEIKIRERGPTPGLMKRGFNKLKQKCYYCAMTFWHRELLGKHFTSAGATEYGYTPRKRQWRGSFKASYIGRKLKEKGHTKPLVFSGESMALTRMRDVRATSKRGVCVIRAPGFNRRNPHSQVNMREEITRVSTSDASRMVRTYERKMDAELRAYRATKTTTIP